MSPIFGEYAALQRQMLEHLLGLTALARERSAIAWIEQQRACHQLLEAQAPRTPRQPLPIVRQAPTGVEGLPEAGDLHASQ